MTASKDGNDIVVDGSPNTLLSITSDIVDINFIEENPSDIYTLKAGHRLIIRHSGVTTIGQSGDFSFHEEFHLAPSSDFNVALIVQTGGELQIFGNSLIKNDSISYLVQCELSGKIYVRGSAVYQPIFDGFYRLYHSLLSGNQADVDHDIWDWDYATIKNFGALGHGLFFYILWNTGQHLFKHLTIDGKEGAVGAVSSILACIYATQDDGINHSDVTIEDSIVRNASYGVQRLRTSGPILRNVIIEKQSAVGIFDTQYMTARKIKMLGAVSESGYNGQHFFIHEGVVYRDNYTLSHYSQSGDSLFKDCDFQDPVVRNLQVSVHGRIRLWTGNTFASTYLIELVGLVLWVFALDLIVTNTAGNPIKGATVTVVQDDGYETYQFFTNAEGKVDTQDYLNGLIILGEKAQSDPSDWNQTDDWSAHTITACKAGYLEAHANVVMDQDQALTLILKGREPATAKVVDLCTPYLGSCDECN